MAKDEEDCVDRVQESDMEEFVALAEEVRCIYFPSLRSGQA